MKMVNNDSPTSIAEGCSSDQMPAGLCTADHKRSLSKTQLVSSFSTYSMGHFSKPSLSNLATRTPWGTISRVLLNNILYSPLVHRSSHLIRVSRCDLPFANPIWLFQFFSLLYFGSHGYREDCSIKFPKRSDWLTSLLEFCGSPSCLWKWVANYIYIYISLLDTYLEPHPWLSWLYNNQPTQEPSRRHMAILSQRSQPYQISVGTSHHCQRAKIHSLV